MAKVRLRLSLNAWRRLALKIGASGANLNPRLCVLHWVSRPLYAVLGCIRHKTYSSAIENAVPLSSIIVLGFWQSATTFLYEPLCYDPRRSFLLRYPTPRRSLANIGTPRMDIRHFGMPSVSGRSRGPCPAASKNAFTYLFPIADAGKKVQRVPPRSSLSMNGSLTIT